MRARHASLHVGDLHWGRDLLRQGGEVQIAVVAVVLAVLPQGAEIEADKAGEDQVVVVEVAKEGGGRTEETVVVGVVVEIEVGLMAIS